MTESLSQKQARFTVMVARLIEFASQNNLDLTFGEAYRTPEMAEFYAKNGKGIKDSVHCHRLAVDLNLFIDGKYQASTEAYKALGEYFESIGGCWGGRFNDGNHFSLEHNGKK